MMQRPNDSSLSGNDEYEGYCADIAKMIAEHVGFSYEIKPVKDKKYGAKDDNDVWNGIVGELVRRVSSIRFFPLNNRFNVCYWAYRLIFRLQGCAGCQRWKLHQVIIMFIIIIIIIIIRTFVTR